MKIKVTEDIVKITLSKEQSRKLASILRFSGFIPDSLYDCYEFNKNSAEEVSWELHEALDEANVGGR